MWLEIWSDYGCFTRPEMRIERVSYSVIPPTAISGILRAIYWHPGLIYRTHRIFICSPIQKTTMKINERSANGKSIVQKTVRCLKNPHYLIDFSMEFCPHFIAAEFDKNGRDANGFTVSDRLSKAWGIMERRIENGQCAHQPCMGMSSYPLFFKKHIGLFPSCPEELKGMKDFDYLPYEIYSIPDGRIPCECGMNGSLKKICSVKQSQISFFEAVAKDGMIIVPSRGGVIR